MKVSELTGAELDWWVAKACGWALVEVPPDYDGEHAGEALVPPDFPADYRWPEKGKVSPSCMVLRWSSRWEHCGPLIKRFRIALVPCGDLWGAFKPWSVDGPSETFKAECPLVAICRAIVASVYGDEVPEGGG
jgi:hypothetical protein